MSLRQKIMFSIGVLLLGLVLACCGKSFWLRIAGGAAALDGLFLHWLWYRCPACDGHLDWSQNWTYCPHCGAWIDYDKK